jgi:hypothetical protein
MLSGAKHLLFLSENEKKQILRCAQNDIANGIGMTGLGSAFQKACYRFLSNLSATELMQ